MKVINVILIGPGNVGLCFLKQLWSSTIKLENEEEVSFKIRGVLSSRKMRISTSLTLEEVVSPSSKDETSNVLSPVDFIGKFNVMDEAVSGAGGGETWIFVDATSSQDISLLYPMILKKGFNIVTPNKKAFSSSLDSYNLLKREAKLAKRWCLHEATVGAGLPILSTLRNLILSGDRILKIEGILSGTLSFIFNKFSTTEKGSGKEQTFSEIVGEARVKGYTEPDPRDDLNGLDVARKVVILGRVAGLSISLEDLEVQNIVPKELRETPNIQSFLDQLPTHDSHFTTLKETAFAQGKVLRYVGLLDFQRPGGGGGGAMLKPYDFSHPFAAMKGSDNIVAFTTERFPEGAPLIVQGAGAGGEVTAFGMMCDVLKISNL